MTDGQLQALADIREIESASKGSLSVVSDPFETNGFVRVDISTKTSDIRSVPSGISLRARERFKIFVPEDFPFSKPSVYTPHKRFAGHPHVQWSSSLCLYLAPDVEWDPCDGMFGFIDRLHSWIEKAAIDQLDPDGGPIHPPATYPRQGPRRFVVPRIDTPRVEDNPWTGLAKLRVVDDHRVDVVGWEELFPKQPVGPVAATVLLADTMPWEFPTRVSDLITLLAARGISKNLLLLIMQAAAVQNDENTPLYVLVGAPMRGIRGDSTVQQHITAWRLEAVIVKALRIIINKYSKKEALRQIGQEVEDLLFDWASGADISWCHVLEERPEIVTRRDYLSPVGSLRGKSVSVWGCGALGGPIAIHLTRAGVSRIVLRDNAIVSPGVLVRQPYDDADIGKAKVESLAAKLRAIRGNDPDFEVVPEASNVLTSSLSGNDWTDDADIVFDCTASRAVRVKLEKILRINTTRRTDIVSMIVSREAKMGLVVVACSDYSGGPMDVYRKAKIDICRRSVYRHFADSFYPHDPNEKSFQPEPGCSSPTFMGSSVDTGSLAASLLNIGITYLSKSKAETRTNNGAKTARAWAQFLDLTFPATADSSPSSTADFSYPPDIVTQDPRRNYEIRTSVTAWEEMQLWAARSGELVGPEVETGGLSFGERNDATGIVWVSEVTGPPSDSTASPLFFQCGTAGTLQAHLIRENRSRGGIRFIGMWHTHPESAPIPSTTDFSGMHKILSEQSVKPSKSLLSILGTPHLNPVLATFVFDRSDIRQHQDETYRTLSVAIGERIPGSLRRPNFGLALSGGGSRAIAFHLGCLRALQERGLLEKIGVISAVSGGAVIAAMYAYLDHDFETFEGHVCTLLRRGLQSDIVAEVFRPMNMAKALGTVLSAGLAAKAAQIFRAFWKTGYGLIHRESRLESPEYLANLVPPLPRWASRTTAFESVLRKQIFGNSLVTQTRREGLNVVLNATELRTGNAFRFGNLSSSCSRLGTVQEELLVATAVAASAAYPAFLPALHRRYTFDLRGDSASKRVILTDGGVYDNLGASCLDPTRNPAFTDHVYPCDHLICCNAGQGQWDASALPYGWASRMLRTVEATFKKSQDRTMNRLFAQQESGILKGLALPYLGLIDKSLESDATVGPLPTDFVSRDRVINYPTDFRAMSNTDIELISKRGEQLTHLLIEAYWPD